jgi:CRP-like cAMP-binding protein
MQEIPYFRRVLERTDHLVLQNLLNTCKRKCYGSGVAIFRQGDSADYACIVEEGEVVFFVSFLSAGQSPRESHLQR